MFGAWYYGIRLSCEWNAKTLILHISKKLMEILLEGTGLTVKGNCLIKELEPLVKSLGELIESDRNSIQLDLSNVNSIDTAGIQLLASCRNSALARGKTFSIVSMSDSVRDALDITGLQNIFENKRRD